MPSNKKAVGEKSRMYLRFGQILGALALTLFCWPSQARELRVAVVTDGPTMRQALTAEVVEREIVNVSVAGSQIVLPVDKRFAGDWSLDGAAAVLDRALTDRDRGVRTLAENGIRALWCRAGNDAQRQQLAIVIRTNAAGQYAVTTTEHPTASVFILPGPMAGR